ncbi:QacE family quaternary ammonium compound efflux SMR transporter [Gordonia sp. X0973]|uniref:DMT family transporter n=1 Tax=Gordonia sp. X0973 TaxID=2742602 RepID=UPI000F53728B|nr:SMR family transporter [Gordonia sp. X0973]QKT05890.1 QacE family quaternary ammonium compound efflux SMR transporter [Gordonia sp. X0973]
MSWIMLIVSGLMEAVWATALGRSDGLSKATPSIVFGVALLVSMAGLAYAMRDIPTGTAYAVWVGIGAAVTVMYAMASGAEAANLMRIVCLIAIVGGVVGLKLAA